jgi:hypothetical protein
MLYQKTLKPVLHVIEELIHKVNFIERNIPGPFETNSIQFTRFGCLLHFLSR